jgi:hypothetical protein
LLWSPAFVGATLRLLKISSVVSDEDKGWNWALSARMPEFAGASGTFSTSSIHHAPADQTAVVTRNGTHAALGGFTGGRRKKFRGIRGVQLLAPGGMAGRRW